MKLVINISEETYIKAKAGILGSLGEIIANGIPYEERPHGEWIEKIYTEKFGHGYLTHHEIVCSVCGGSGENDENIPQNYKFCPNCGADMREGGAE